MWIPIVTIIAFVTLMLVYRRNRRSPATELWKTYALALEVIIECSNEYKEEIEGEGCMTRSRRLARIAEQQVNALLVATRTREQLTDIKEYE